MFSNTGDNIQIGLKETGSESMDWFQLTQD